jgi:hypothetical protein
MLVILLPPQDWHKKRRLPRWFKNTLLISTAFASGFLAHTIEPPLFTLCTTLPSGFITLIEQSQTANAMQSLEGIFQIAGILFATYTFCQRHARAKKTEDPMNNQGEQGNSPPGKDRCAE